MSDFTTSAKFEKGIIMQYLKKHCLMLIVCLCYPQLSSAVRLDLAGSRVRIQSQKYNVTSNFIVSKGRIIMGDTRDDSLMIRSIIAGEQVESNIPLSPQPLFVVNIDDHRVAVSDTWSDLVFVIDTETSQVLHQHNYAASGQSSPPHFGPWHLYHHQGVIYGSNRFNAVDSGGLLYSLVTTFDIESGKAMKTWPPQWRHRDTSPHEINHFSGPAHLVVVDNQLVVIERGHPADPRDDKLSIFDLKSWKRTTRKPVAGNAFEMIQYEDGICLVAGNDGLGELHCGNPSSEQFPQKSLNVGPLPVSLTQGQEHLFVLSKGSSDVEGDEFIKIVGKSEDGSLEVLHSINLSGMGKLDNPRQIAYDSDTAMLVLRTNEQVFAIPVID
jgi:hypothetical protein